MEKRRPSDAHAITKPCPVPACIGGIVWTDDGPVGECPICKGAGVVGLGAWTRYTFNVAKSQ